MHILQLFQDFNRYSMSKNKTILYAKTTNISNVSTIVDMFKKIIILRMHFAIISKILIVIEMSKNKAILYVNFANISTIILFFDSICFDFNNYLILVFDNFLCFDFKIKFTTKFKNDI